jgi:hypothetical protein
VRDGYGFEPEVRRGVSLTLGGGSDRRTGVREPLTSGTDTPGLGDQSPPLSS